MSKPYTIKLQDANNQALVTQAAESNKPPTTLLQERVNAYLEKYGQLPESIESADFQATSAAQADALNASQADLQAANDRLQALQQQLADTQQTLLVVVKNAKTHFPISDKQLYKDAIIQP